MAEIPHRKLTKCHVLFLGDSTPKESSRGLKALQQPLMTCYPVDKPSEVEGIDSWITIFTSGILMQFVGNRSDKPAPIWFPIQNLHVAAATKCINYIDPNTGQRMETEFVDINNEIAERSSHPPLFSIIVRKTSGKRVLKCYTFLVRDEAPAIAMVDASKYAFTHEAGWSNSHPPEQVIQNELVAAADDTDDIDEFDSVSTAGRKTNKNQNSPPGNPSAQDIGDTYEQSAQGSQASRTFPSHLVRKYTLTNTNRGFNGSPTRRPIPPEFMHQSVHDSMRSSHYGIPSSHHGIRSGPPLPAYMMNGGQPIPGSLAGSMRATSSVRVINDPRTRTSIIEKVIRQPVPVPVPVYQPPPPPQIIREPVYIPQPPEIRHIPVDRHVPVPVEVPVPYPVSPDPRQFEAQQQHYSRSSKHGHRKKSHKQHNTFKNYQIFDERFSRQEPNRPSFFVNSDQTSPPNGYFPPPDEHYHARHRKKSDGRRGRRNSESDSRSSSSDVEDRRRYKGAWEQPSHHRHRNGIEITELSSPDDRGQGRSKYSDMNGNHKGSHNIRQLEKDTANYHIRETPNAENVDEKDFQWTPISSSKPSRGGGKSEKKSRKEERRSKDITENPDYGDRDRGRFYVGADPVEVDEAKPSGDSKRSSFQVYRPDDKSRNTERQDKKKDKKKRDKTPSKYETHEAAEDEASTSKQYYLKEKTEKPPRNWMDEQKGYMNEKAFSSSLAKEPDADGANAYALNTDANEDDMFHRAMPGGPLPTGGIPVPPPLPENFKIGGRIAADLY